MLAIQACRIPIVIDLAAEAIEPGRQDVDDQRDVKVTDKLPRLKPQREAHLSLHRARKGDHQVQAGSGDDGAQPQ